jgi:hypothetical protein
MNEDHAETRLPVNLYLPHTLRVEGERLARAARISLSALVARLIEAEVHRAERRAKRMPR